jgi:biopolymer transport protein ExbD/biopolymer transport protein TolR
MAMTLGGSDPKTGVAPAMNVTPLVDVVLVLLIIFMVITPLLSKHFWVHIPKQEKEEVPLEEIQKDPDPPLVVRVGKGDVIEVNGTVIPFDELPLRLRRMFAARDDHILFFDADDDASYGFAVSVLDQAREGGAVTIAPLTDSLEKQAAQAAPTPPGADAGATPPAAAPAPPAAPPAP